MSKEEVTSKIKDANAILSLAKALFSELQICELSDFDNPSWYFCSLTFIRTSFYHTLVLNLYHLLKDSEEHSISNLVDLAIAHLEFDPKDGELIKKELAANSETVKELKVARDKRIAHFDINNTAPLSDKTIGQLIDIAEKQLKILNLKALKVDHNFNMVVNNDMKLVMKALMTEFDRIHKKQM